MSVMVGDFVVKCLAASSAVSGLVGERVFPLVIPEGTEYPFIVFEDSCEMTEGTKDGNAGDRVNVDVLVLSKSYQESVVLADGVRKALDGKTGDFDGFSVGDCVCEGWDKDYNGDLPAYLVRLRFLVVCYG